MNVKFVTRVVLLAIVVALLAIGQRESFAQFSTESGTRLPFLGHYSVSTGPGCSTTHSYNGSRYAIDFADGFAIGTPVYAAYPGTVTEATMSGDFGGTITTTISGFTDRYGHLSKIYVQVGQTVSRGDLLALSGNTGLLTSGPHLHFEIRDETGSGFNIAENINGLVWDDTTQPIDYCYDSPSDADSYSANATGPALPSNPYTSCENFYSQGFPNAAIFDHKDCQGNYIFLPNTNSEYHLADLNFDDRVRSIYIPPGKSVFMAADVNNPLVLSYCHAIDMWNMDIDSYENSTTKIGWQNGLNGINMISFMMILNNSNCQLNGQNVKNALASTYTAVGVYTEGYGGQTGNSHVDFYENTNSGGTQYGHDQATNGVVNIVNYLNDRVSSTAVDSGFSAMIYEDTNGLGGKKCVVAGIQDLSSAYYDNSHSMTDTMSSYQIFEDSTCGGQYTGTAPGDLLTFYVNEQFDVSQARWGVHDLGTYNLPNYLANSATSIGLEPGNSVIVYDGPNATGGFACFTASDLNLTDNSFNTQVPLNDNAESFTFVSGIDCGNIIHAPKITTISATVTNPSTGESTVTYVLSDAAPGYSIHTDFGDGANFDMQGPTVNSTVTHNYAYGSYTIVVSVRGTDGYSYPYSIPITVSAPATATPVVPTYSLTVDSTNTASGLVNFTLDWSNALADWHHIDFGDGQSFDVNGASGHQTASHVYNPGQNPYTLSFTVKGQDTQNYVSSQQVSMPLPTVSLTINSVDPVTGFTMYTAEWTNAPIDSWQRITFGQEDFYVDYQGASDTKVDSHVYPPGTYTMTLTVNCRNGQTYTATQQVVVTGPTATPVPPTVTPAPPSYSLTIDSVDQSSGLTTFTLDWGSALADWHHIDFGDGQAFDVNGGSGHQQATHIYNPGTYIMTFTVKGLDGQNYPSTQQVTVSGPPTATPVPAPTLSLTILSVDNATGVVTFQAVWNNALNDWQHMDFGHDGAYVDYQGGSGDHTDSNIIPVGTFTFTLTVKGLNGQNYTASQQVTRS